MKINEIEEMLEDIIAEYSSVSLHSDDGEDSYLYEDGNGKIVWDQSLSFHPDIYVVRELDDDELEVLLDLLLDNGIISKETYDYLIG